LLTLSLFTLAEAPGHFQAKFPNVGHPFP